MFSGCSYIDRSTTYDVNIINKSSDEVRLTIKIVNDSETAFEESVSLEASESQLQTSTFEKAVAGNHREEHDVLVQTRDSSFEYTYTISCEEHDKNNLYIEIINKHLIEFNQSRCHPS